MSGPIQNVYFTNPIVNSQIENLQTFQTNYPPYLSYEASNESSGNYYSTSFVKLSTNNSTLNGSGPWDCPSGPYQLTIAQMCNPDMFFEVPDNTGAYPGGILDESLIRSYWINIPFGNVKAYGGSGALDAELWQAWKGEFGFDKIPVGFGVGFSLGVKPGTEINYIIGNYNSNPTGSLNYSIFNRMTSATYITNNAGSGPYQVLRSVRNLPGGASQNYTSPFTIFYEAPNQATVYEPSYDTAFATDFPTLYATPASALNSNQVNRPPNAA